MSTSWVIRSRERLKTVQDLGPIKLLGAPAWLSKVPGTRTGAGGPNILRGSAAENIDNIKIIFINSSKTIVFLLISLYYRF